MRGAGEASVSAHLRRQGITVTKIKKSTTGRGKVTEKDISLFTRQLATMLKSGVPLLQAFDIVGKGHDNPAVARLLFDIKTDVETGSSLEQSFRKFPLYFDDLYCNLLGAGEAAGILDTLLDRLANLQGKDPCHQEQDQIRVVLSGLHHRHRLRHHCRHHDLRDPGVQRTVQEFRCRLARSRRW